MQDNYFTLFGTTPSLEPDLAALQQKYFVLQQQFHPDKNKDGFTQSANLNEAYATLKNRFKRLEYVVKLFHPAELKTDQMFLMEMMELREEYEENPIETEPKIKGEIEKLFKQAVLAFNTNNMDDVASYYTKIKYLQNVITNP